MENKRTIATFVLLAAIIFAGGYLFYRQNRILKMLESKPEAVELPGMPAASISGGQDSGDSVPPAYDPAEATKKELTDRTQDITGVIKQISGSELTIEAQIIDLSKLETLEYPITQALEKISKVYKVKTDARTKFEGVTLDSLKIGDNVYVVSSEKIYTTDKLNAVSVKLFPVAK